MKKSDQGRFSFFFARWLIDDLIAAAMASLFMERNRES